MHLCKMYLIDDRSNAHIIESDLFGTIEVYLRNHATLLCNHATFLRNHATMLRIHAIFYAINYATFYVILQLVTQ
jgi:hypothetical protein